MSGPCRWTRLASDGAARCGRLATPHGEAATPAFMAVATLGGLKGVTADAAAGLGQRILLANTYHLALRPGAERVRRLGGLHAFCGWDGPMLTDSGGYQVFSLAAQRRIDDDGVTFRSHLDGTLLRLTPEESIRVQRLLGADIIMAFDECPPATASRAEVERAVQRTADWLARSVAAWRAADGPGGDGAQALFAIVQGGLDPALRAASVQAALRHELPGYAIGGLAVGEGAAERLAVLEAVTPLLPADRPRYLMGVGTPLDVVEAVCRGIDLFDCVLPTRMGRHGIAYTDEGPLRLKRAAYAEDPRPIDDRTPSPARRLSRGYLHHLLKSGEMLGGILLSLHNLAYYQQLMARLRAAIRRGALADFAAAFRARYRDDAADAADAAEAALARLGSGAPIQAAKPDAADAAEAAPARGED